MQDDRLGLREYVAIAAAGVAVLFALLYFAPSASSGSDPLAIRTGEPVASGLPTEASPTATETAAEPLKDPGRWFVRHYSGLDPRRSVIDGEAVFPSLNISYDAAPYPGLRDDNWSLTAESTTELPAGRYSFTIVMDGEVSVRVAGEDLDAGPDANVPRERTFAVDHDGGPLKITLTGVDREGVLMARWK